MAGEIKINDVSIATESGGTVTLGNATLGSTVVLGTNASPIASNLVLAAGNGIDFSAASGSAAGSSSAVLDDYEEGTWSPTLSGSTTAGTYETDATTNGKYIKIGNMVTVSFNLKLAAVITGGGSGYAKILGFPFQYTGAASPGTCGAPSISGVNFDNAAVQLIIGKTASGFSNEFLIAEIKDSAAPTALNISGFTASDSVQHTFTYFVP